MGAFCCCSCGDEFENYPSFSISRDFQSLTCFLQQCFSWGTASNSWAIGGQLSDSSMTTTLQSVSRPLPFDADQRYSRTQRDGLVSRREKSMTHFQEGSLPLMRDMGSSSVELLGSGKTSSLVELLEDDKHGPAESSGNLQLLQVSPGVLYVQPSTEEEDVCPTCLEEYTEENPKITAQCSHHFHLGCIYEWMERSDNCPVCGKEMEFSESP